MTTETYEMPWWIAVEDFYDEEYGKEDYSDAKNAAFEMARDLGPSVAIEQLGKALAEFKQYHKDFDELQVCDEVVFEECDSGNLTHAMAYFKVDMKGSREAFAKFIGWYLGEEDPLEYIKGGLQPELPLTA